MNAVMRLILLGLCVAAIVYWVYALTHYNPEERPCDEDCESCPFPTEGCSWKTKMEDKKR